MQAARLIAVSALLAAAPFAQAQDSGAYLGGGLGRSHIRFDNGSFAANSANVTESNDKRATGYTAFLGYNFDKTWAVEGGYTRLGDFKYNYSGTGPLAGMAGQADYKATSWWLAGKGTIAVTDKWDLYAKLGLAENRARDAGSSNNAAMDAVLGTPFTRNKTHAGLLAGIGTEYHFTKQVGVRLEYDDYGKFGTSGAQNRANLGMWTADVAYHF
jgi:OOP family OmpA-OmpF porin